jgi:hypothetical protein
MKTFKQRKIEETPGPYDLIVQVDDEDTPWRYACAYQLGDEEYAKRYEVVVVENFYDLVYPCTMPKQNAVKYIAETLLNDAALAWNLLPEGVACMEFQDSYPYKTWIFGVANGNHTLITDFGCQKLSVPNPEICCQVVRAEMKFTPSGGYNKTSFEQFVAGKLNSDELTASFPSIKTAAIAPAFPDVAPQNEDPRDNLDPPIPVSSVKAQQENSPESDRDISVVGGFVITGLVAAFLGLIFILVRRRRVHKQATAQDEGDLNDIRVTVLSDGDASFPNVDSPFLQEVYISTVDLAEEDEDDPYSPKNMGAYQFDLGQSFKNNVMGTYFPQNAPTSMHVVAPYALDDTSDSEVDSWAQTEGTVGSLEERLEEITAEI